MNMKRACLILLILVATTTSSAAVSLPFSSSLNTPGQCGEWDQSQGLNSVNCDGWTGYGTWNNGPPYYESVTTAANNAGGAGGRGIRHWVGTGKNSNSGGMRLTFNTQSELWIRFYKRYAAGFSWSPMQEDKMLWLGGTSGAPETAIFSYSRDSFRFWNQNQSSPPGNNTIYGTANTGWNNVMGRSVSDGLWHCYEVHVKMNSSPGVYDGVEQAWIDGVLVLDATGVNLGGGPGWGNANFNINSDYAVPVGGQGAVDLDDVAVSTSGYIGPIGGGGAIVGGGGGAVAPGAGGGTLVAENFDNSNFSSRGWYDTSATSASISATEHIPGSAGSFECRFQAGGTNCVGGDPKRHLITPSDEMYVTYWVKHSTNWIGSGVGYHPHMFYILGDLDGDYSGFYGTYLDTYIEEFWSPPGTTGLYRIGVQDSLNIPTRTTNGTNPIASRFSATENRDVGGCSGQVAGDTVSYSECYWGGTAYLNWKDYRSSAVFNAGNKNAWHKVTAHLKMNTASGGVAQANGIARMWLDDVLIVDRTTVVYRTGQNANMRWKQFNISPYIGNGSPVDQTIWIDDLTVTTQAPSTQVPPVGLSPNPVTGITIR